MIVFDEQVMNYYDEEVARQMKKSQKSARGGRR